MKIIEINSDNFEKEVLKSDKLVIADFNANWCGPCRMLRPTLDEIAEENENIKIVSINVDEEDALAEQYGVSSIPCLVFFEKGKEVKRNIGLVPKDALEEMIGEF